MLNSEEILRGIDLAVERLIEFKKYKKTPFVIERDGKIIEVSPEEMEIYLQNLKKNKSKK